MELVNGFGRERTIRGESYRLLFVGDLEDAKAEVEFARMDYQYVRKVSNRFNLWAVYVRCLKGEDTPDLSTSEIKLINGLNSAQMRIENTVYTDDLLKFVDLHWKAGRGPLGNLSRKGILEFYGPKYARQVKFTDFGRKLAREVRKLR